jgi:flagellar P-ring protein precursor FlgI
MNRHSVGIRGAAATLVALTVIAAAPEARATRLKDIVSLSGTNSSPLLGYGLVVGLNKTGDRRQTVFPAQTLANMLSRFGLSVSADDMKVENIAAVLVTAEMPAYARAGARLDVTVSSIGDARSLQGGTLLATPLRGAAGSVVGLAQGPLSIGGFGGGSGSTSVVVNHLTVGRVPGGGIVETTAMPALMPGGILVLALRDPDFTTASRVTQAINADLGSSLAKTIDAGTVELIVPDSYRNSVPDLMARLDGLMVEVDAIARVVINERTGTVVVGGDVRIGPAAVAHGNLSVRIATRFDASQPAPLSLGGETVVVPNQRVDVQEGTAKLIALEEGATLEAVTRALNALGATPRDIIAIMQALKAAGALRAEIVIL